MKVKEARSEEIEYDHFYQSIISTVWECNDYEELKEETKKLAIRIGELSLTLKIAKIIKCEENEEYTIDNKFSFYTNLLSKGLAKKKKSKCAENELNIELAQLLCKLQYLSIILFNNGESTNINSENWIIETIQSAIIAFIKSKDELDYERLFPIVCCYLSIDKYLLFVEQVNSLSKKDVGYMLTTWLNALEEYKANCFDDSFWHLVEFFDNGKEVEDESGNKHRGFNEYVQLLIAEKIIGLGVILLNSTIENECAIKFAANLMKHFNFNKTKGKHMFNVFKHEGYTKTEKAEISQACKKVLLQLTKTLKDFRDDEMFHMYSTNVKGLFLTLLYNASEEELKEFKELWKLILISEAYHTITKNVFESYLLNDFTHYIEKSTNIDIVSVELIHNEDFAPNMELLKKEEMRQYRLMAIHKQLYIGLKKQKLNKKFIRQPKVLFDREKYEAIQEAKALGYIYTTEDIIKVWNTQRLKDAYNLILKLKDMQVTLLSNFYTLKIYNALDFHYLSNMFEQIDQYYVNAVKIFGGVMMNKKETLPMTAEGIEAALEKMLFDLEKWKKFIFVPDKKYIEQRKAINKLKWTQSTTRQRVRTSLTRIKPRIGVFGSINLKNKVKSIIDKFSRTINT